MRRNRVFRIPQANHRREVYPSNESRPEGDAPPKHKHRFKSYTLEKDERNGRKIQIVECAITGCGLQFVRDKEFKP